MSYQKNIMKYAYRYILIFTLFSTSLLADTAIEKDKINFLIVSVERLQATFIRNGREYSPKEAAEHLRMKLNNAMGSMFAPSEDKWTADLFIEKVASRSSLSGDVYKIRFPGGQEVTAEYFLKQKLKEYKR